MTTKHSPILLSWSILVVLAFVWGSSYILIKRGLIAYNPEQVACLRVGISALAFVPILLWRAKSLQRPKRSLLKYMAIVGYAGSFIPAFLFAVAQTEISSSTTGVLSSLTPVFTFILGIVLFSVSFTWVKASGVIVGIAGATMLILFGNSAGLEGDMSYGFLVMLATMLYALSANVIKTYLQDVGPITISAVSFIMIGPPAIIYLFFNGFIDIIQTHPYAWQSLFYITLLAIGSTVIASILFFKLVQMTDAVFSSTVSYLVPIVAVIWGAADGELITLYHLLAIGLILTGVFLSSK